MNPVILCIDDQRDVLAALKHDLACFEDKFDIVTGESAREAFELLDEFEANERMVFLIICDHIMPGKNGVMMLSELEHGGRFPIVRKLLLTGLASHQDTIEAINKAMIDCYIEKPWKQDELIGHVKCLLTRAVMDRFLDHTKFSPHMDTAIVFEHMRSRI